MIGIALGLCITQVPEGNGSGVVWDGNGHIVTNYHGENLQMTCFDYMTGVGLVLPNLSFLERVLFMYLIVSKGYIF